MLEFQDWGTAAHSKNVRLLKAFKGRSPVGMIHILRDDLFVVMAYECHTKPLGSCEISVGSSVISLGSSETLQGAKDLLQEAQA